MRNHPVVRAVRVSACTALVAVALTACQLPDVGGFADAVASSSQGVTQAGDVVVTEAKAFHERDWDEDRKANTAATIQQLESAWAVRVTTLRALSEYSDSLASIVDAGMSGRESAQQLGAAVDGLFESFGATGVAGSEAFKVGGELYGLIAQAAAARSLADAVETAQPAVARICEILRMDLNDVSDALNTLEQDELAALEDDSYNDARALLASCIEKRRALSADFEAAAAGSAQLDVAIERMKQLDEMIAAHGEIVNAVDAAKGDVGERFRRYSSLNEQTRALLVQIAVTHESLGRAVRANRTVSARTLMYGAEQIMDTVDRIEAIRGSGR